MFKRVSRLVVPSVKRSGETLPPSSFRFKAHYLLVHALKALRLSERIFSRLNLQKMLKYGLSKAEKRCQNPQLLAKIRTNPGKIQQKSTKTAKPHPVRRNEQKDHISTGRRRYKCVVSHRRGQQHHAGALAEEVRR